MSLRFDGMFNYCSARNLLQSLQVKDFGNSLTFGTVMVKNTTVPFFLMQWHIFLAVM